MVISGYYGFGNVGDEAVLAAILQQLKHLWPEARFTVLSGNPQATVEEHGVNAISRGDLRALRKSFSSQRTVLVSGGGTLFQDVTSSRSLYYYLSLLLMARRYQIPVVIYGQGVGPFRRKWNQRLTGRILRGTQLVILRDQQAYDDVRAWNLLDKDKLCLGADPVLALEPSGHYGSILKSESRPFKDGPILLVSLRPWPTLAHHLNQLATALDTFSREGWQVVFLPFQYDSDYPICRDCASLMDEPAEVWDRPLTAQETLSLTEEADYCLGMRLHSLIFAAIWGLPMVGLAYDPKVEGFLKELDLAEFVLDLPDTKGGLWSSSHLVGLMKRLADEEEAITAQIKAKTILLKERATAANRRMEETLYLFQESW